MASSARILRMEAKPEGVPSRRGRLRLAVMLWFLGLLASVPLAIFGACIRCKIKLTRLLDKFRM